MLNRQLTKNFKLSELCCPCCWSFNMPDWMLEKIQAVRDDFGFNMQITSACRCESHNRAVGGEVESRHLSGLAIDVKCNQNGLRKLLIKAAEKNGVTGIGIGKTFLHFDWDKREACWIY